MKCTMTTPSEIFLSANARFLVFYYLLLYSITFHLHLLFQFLLFLWFLSSSLHSTFFLSLYFVPHNPPFLYSSLLLFCSSSFFYPRCLCIDPPKNLPTAILESPSSLSCVWTIFCIMVVKDI